MIKSFILPLSLSAAMMFSAVPRFSMTAPGEFSRASTNTASDVHFRRKRVARLETNHR